MEGTKIICRLCLNFTNCDESQVLDNVSKDMLQFILPQVNLNITHDPKICQACYKSVLSCYRFKSNCNKDVNSEAKKDSSSRESETISIQDEELEKKCNFCSSSRVEESSEEFNYRKTYFVEVLQKCLPEWNLSTKTVPCKKCLDILTSQFTFIGNCADTEDKLKHYCLTQGTNSEGKLNLYEAVRHILSKENKNVASTANELVFCDESVENVNIAENDSLREANDDVPFPEVEVNTRVLKTEEVDIKPEALDEEYMESERLDEPGGSGSVTSQALTFPVVYALPVHIKPVQSQTPIDAKKANISTQQSSSKSLPVNKRSIGIQVNPKDLIPTCSVGIQVDLICSPPPKAKKKAEVKKETQAKKKVEPKKEPEVEKEAESEEEVEEMVVSSTTSSRKRKFKPRILRQAKKANQSK